MIRLSAFVLFLMLPAAVIAQGYMGFYSLEGRVPQTNLINPSFFPEAKVVVAFPGLGSTNVFLDADRFSFKRILVKDGDSLRFEPDNFINKLQKKNRLGVGVDMNLFYLGIQARKNYFSLSANTKVTSSLLISKKLIEWALYGPADERNINQPLDFSDLGGSVMSYHEFTLGYGRKLLGDRLQVGIRFKYLNGIAEASAKDINGYIYTGLDSIQLYNEAFTLNTSGIDNFDNNTSDLILGFTNPGFAIDIGARYQINSKFSVSAAITDMGSIKWKSNLKGWEFNEVNYVFKGFDVLDVINESDVIDNELDSLENLYDINEIEGKSYRTPLVTKTYLGGRFQFHPKQNVSLILYNDFFQGNVKSALGLNYGLQVGRSMDVLVGLSYRDRSLANFTFGTAFSLGFFQLYFLSENFPSLFVPQNARKLDLRFGINFQFGRKRKGSV